MVEHNIHDLWLPARFPIDFAYQKWAVKITHKKITWLQDAVIIVNAFWLPRTHIKIVGILWPWGCYNTSSRTGHKPTFLVSSKLCAVAERAVSKRGLPVWLHLCLSVVNSHAVMALMIRDAALCTNGRKYTFISEKTMEILSFHVLPKITRFGRVDLRQWQQPHVISHGVPRRITAAFKTLPPYQLVNGYSQQKINSSFKMPKCHSVF